MAITVMCSPSEPGAFLSKEWSKPEYPIYLKRFAEGCVISLREMNGYDDSDFYATYYEPESGEFKETLYASTRGWTYPCGAVVDATPEVLEKWRAYCKARNEAYYAKVAAAEAAKPTKGKTVKVIRPVRGKAALKGGETGKVFWYGEDKFSRYSKAYRVGVELEEGRKVFISAGAVEVVPA